MTATAVLQDGTNHAMLLQLKSHQHSPYHAQKAFTPSCMMASTALLNDTGSTHAAHHDDREDGGWDALAQLLAELMSAHARHHAVDLRARAIMETRQRAHSWRLVMRTHCMASQKVSHMHTTRRLLQGAG